MPLDAVFHEFQSDLYVLQVIHLRVYTCSYYFIFVACGDRSHKGLNTYFYCHSNASPIISYTLEHVMIFYLLI